MVLTISKGYSGCSGKVVPELRHTLSAEIAKKQFTFSGSTLEEEIYCHISKRTVFTI